MNATFFRDWLKKQTTWLSLLSVAACQTTKNNAAQVKVVGGVEDYTTAPAAVGLWLLDAQLNPIPYQGRLARCTGAIVRDDLILTAAHCVRALSTKVTSAMPFDRSPDGPLARRALKAKAVVVFPSQTFDVTNVATILNADVAFFVYDPGAFSGMPMAHMSKTPAKAGDPVTVVGYGMTDLSDEGNPQAKRFSGTNSVARIMPQLAGAIVLESAFVGVTDVVSGEGDSGGSLYNAAGEVIGITTGGGLENNQTGLPNSNALLSATDKAASYYTNVSDPGIKSFINAVMGTKNPTAAAGQNVVATPIDSGP